MVGDDLAFPADGDTLGNTITAVGEWLNARYPEVGTLGLDINNYRRSPFRVDEYQTYKMAGFTDDVLKASSIRKSLRLNAEIYSKARGFLHAKGRPYLCVHWRRGDVSVDLAPHFLPQNVEWMIRALRGAFMAHGSHFHALVLITDNPYPIELNRLAGRVLEEFGLPTFRSPATDPTLDLPVDLAIGALADLFLGTYPGSFFARYIAEERRLHHQLSGASWLSTNTQDEL